MTVGMSHQASGAEHVTNARRVVCLELPSSIMADSIVAELRKIPPVTRFLTLSLVGTTVPYLLNIVSPYALLYHRDAVLKKLQVSEQKLVDV